MTAVARAPAIVIASNVVYRMIRAKARFRFVSRSRTSVPVNLYVHVRALAREPQSGISPFTRA